MTEASHQPDPEFVARLEGQLITEYRRLERLGEADRWRPGFGRLLRAAIFLVSGLFLGAASVTLAQRAEDADRLELLRLQAGTQVSLAAQEVEMNRQVVDDLSRQVAVGTIVPTALLSAQAALVAAEVRLALAELDVEEVDASGGPVRNEISAPLVDGRDFVSERLQLRLDPISVRGQSLGEFINLTEVRIRAGTTTSDSLRPLIMERDRLAAEADQIRQLLALRQTFLDGDMGAAEAENRHRLLLATTRLGFAESQLARLRTEGDRVQQRFAVGIAPQSEVVAMQRELFEAEAEVQMAEIEVRLIEQELLP